METRTIYKQTIHHVIQKFLKSSPICFVNVASKQIKIKHQSART